jgi:hypothetical protein
MDAKPPEFTATWKTIPSPQFNSHGIYRKELAPPPTLCDVTPVDMSLLPTPELTRAVLPGPSRFVCRISFCLRHQCQGSSQSHLHRPRHAWGRLSRLLVLAHVLAAALIIAALTASAQGQTSVTLGWDPSPDSAIAGYRLYDGAASGTYTNVVAVGRATSATISNLVNGVTYFFAVTAYDTSGQESDFSDEISYTVPWPTDSLPTLALTSPTNGAVYTAPATIEFAADVAPNGHTVSEMRFYIGNNIKPLGVVVSAPYSFTWTNVSTGTYNLRAKVFYDSGSMVASAAVNVTVATVRPPSGLTFVADSGTMSAPFSGTLAWDPSPDSAIAGYLYEVVASGAYTNVIDVGNATSATVSNLFYGVTYFFAVMAYGSNGLESDFSDEISYAMPWPTESPPTLALTSPANGAVYTAPATINFAAGVAPNGHAISEVQFYNGVTLLGAVTSAPYSFSWNNVSAGTYILSAQIFYDSDGRAASAVVNATVAAGWRPTGLTFVADSGTIGAPFSGTLAWDPGPDNAIAGYLYEVVASGAYTNVIDVGNATSATVSNLVNGVTYFFAVMAYGTNGPVSDFSDEISYTVSLPTNGPPTLALTSPADGAVYTAPATINFTADLMPHGRTISEVQFYNGRTLLGAVTSAPYSSSWNNVSAGTYILSVQVVYDSGSTVTSAPVNVTVASRKIGSFHPRSAEYARRAKNQIPISGATTSVRSSRWLAAPGAAEVKR